MTAGYSGTPLPRKLGISASNRTLLVGAPADVDLQAPPGATVHRRRGRGEYDVILLFCPRAAVLHERFADLVPALATAGALWVCWPKRASGIATDLGENAVRDHGLSVGLVDVKVAAVDATWSGLKFVRRRADRPGAAAPLAGGNSAPRRKAARGTGGGDERERPVGAARSLARGVDE